MKRILLALTVLFCTSLSYAQTLNYGIKGGINQTDETINSTLFFNNSRHVTGFNAGGFVELEYNKFVLQSGIYYTTRGFKGEFNIYNQYQEFLGIGQENVKFNYWEIPFNFLYALKITNNIKFRVGGGPYLAYGFNGNANLYSSQFQQTTPIKPINPDYGINFSAGCKLINKITFDASYSLGLANLAQNLYTAKYKGISLSIGYQFN